MKKQSWWQLLTIQVGGTLCLPVILIGQLICQKFGWGAALVSVVAGNAFLLVIGLAFAALSAKKPQSTVEHAADYFGRRGGILFATLMLVSVLGWFAIQLNVITLTLAPSFKGISFWMLTLGIGLFLSGVMCLGMQAMKWLSNLSAPLLGITLFYLLGSSSGTLSMPESISWVSGVSLIIGTNIAGVIDLPTFLQHTRSKKDSMICLVLLYGIVVPFIEIVGSYLYAVAGGVSLFEMAWIGAFIFLSGWATNNANLYSAVISSYTLTLRFSRVARTLGLGMMATILACFNPLGNLENILDVLGVCLASMGAVMIASYLLCLKTTFPSWIPLCSWGTGVLAGIITAFLPGLLTGVPALDGFLIAGGLQLTFNTFWRKQNATAKLG